MTCCVCLFAAEILYFIASLRCGEHWGRTDCAVNTGTIWRLWVLAIPSLYALASRSCNSLSVRPLLSFHSIRPFALRPSATAAAVDGELNG